MMLNFIRFLFILTSVLVSSAFSVDKSPSSDVQIFNQTLIKILHNALQNFDDYKNPANPSCFGCKAALWSAKTFVFGSKAFVHEHIEVTCQNLKNIYTPCKRILTEFLDFAYDVIFTYSSADLCAVAGMCPNPPKINFCPVCLMGVTETKNILLSDALLKEIQAVFVHVCDYVRLEVQCSKILDELYVTMMDVIKHVVEPHLVCKIVKMCDS
uniref:Saposin B-type domain-containing protein n=2 Tax=Trichobilharzia regenti TaxID=157069 RepID=A0AA85KBK4_TRIRE|nr:unnamed protein product [Trichobilharzia regenti]